MTGNSATNISPEVSPSKVPPTVTEVLRDHARLFGKQPLVSPDRSATSESDAGSIVVESTGHESTASCSVDSLELSPLVSPMMQSSRSRRPSTISLLYDNLNESNESDETPGRVSSDGSLSPTVSDLMRISREKQASSRSRDQRSPEGTTKNGLLPTDLRNITLRLNENFKFSHAVPKSRVTPVRSKLEKLHIRATPQEKHGHSSKNIGEEIKKNLHEISPIIQQHLNGTKPSAKRESKVARNIFGSSRRPVLRQTSNGGGSGSSHEGTYDLLSNVFCPVVKLHRLNQGKVRKNKKQCEVIVIDDSDDSQSSSQKCREVERTKGLVNDKAMAKIIISRCDGDSRIVHVPVLCTSKDGKTSDEPSTSYSSHNSSKRETTISHKKSMIEYDLDSSEHDLDSLEYDKPNKNRCHKRRFSSRYPRRKRTAIVRLPVFSSDTLSSDDSSVISMRCRKKRPRPFIDPTTEDDDSCNEFDADPPAPRAAERIWSKRLSCRICNKRFSNRKWVLLHEKTHNINYPFECRICRKKFRHTSTLAEHKQSMHENVTFICHLCKNEFSSKKSLQRHLETHSRTKPFKCSYCSKSFGHKVTLVTHKRLHTGEKPFTCALCRRSFSDKSNFRRHRMSHGNAHSSASHQLSRSPNKRKIELQCRRCSKIFYDQQSLKEHARQTHRGPVYTANHSSQAQHGRNAESHSNTRRTSDKRKHFTDNHRLRQRVTSRRMSTAVNFKCRLCGRNFGSQPDLEYHMAQLHRPRRPGYSYRCFICGQGLKSRPELKAHFATHSDSQDTASSSD